MNADKWTSSETLAWTERDGPGRPPAAPKRWMALTVAASLGVVFTGVMFTDTLCPEHRAWVQGLATAALIGAVVAVVGLLRDWAGAPFITTLVAGTGVSIGLIDMVHSPTRGRAVAVAFALVTVLAGILTTRYMRLARWDLELRRETRRGESATLPAPAPAPAPSPAPAEPHASAKES